jgi:3-hydroxy acid dehydrogenase/malonic semialdehyde reductase
MNKIALVTGATAGIGEATAIKLADEGYDVIITGRRKERLKKLAENIQQSCNVQVHILNFDIRNKVEVDEAIDQLPEQWTTSRFIGKQCWFSCRT